MVGSQERRSSTGLSVDSIREPIVTDTMVRWWLGLRQVSSVDLIGRQSTNRIPSFTLYEGPAIRAAFPNLDTYGVY